MYVLSLLDQPHIHANRQTNLVRCLLAAILVAVINKMTTSRLGPEWTYVLFGGICVLLLPLMYIEMRMGPRWRMKREKKEME